MKTSLLALCVAASFAPLSQGCSPEMEDTEMSDAELNATLSATSLANVQTFNAFSTEGGGFGQAGRMMKFLIDARTAQKKVYFVNSNFKVAGKTPDYAKYHYNFAQKQLGISDGLASFNQSTYNVDKKRFYAGTIQTYTLGNSTELTYAIQFYPDDVVHEQGVLDAAKTVRAAIQIPNAKMAFVATGPQQTFKTVTAPLKTIGVEPMTIDQVLGSVKYLPLNPGEAWGVLRIFPKDQGMLRPTDIPVFDELPLDLSVVAGTITKAYQDGTSHVNLKSKERGTPNMVMRDAATNNPVLTAFANKPVHLVVGKTGFKLEATTMAVVEQKFKARTNKPWIPLAVVNEPNITTYDSMCPSLSLNCLKNAGKFGSKAGNLGFLANQSVLGRFAQSSGLSKAYGYDLVPFGFGIPVQRYRDFVDANPTLKAKIDALIAKEKTGNLSQNERAELSSEVQALFYKGAVPSSQLNDLKSQLASLKILAPSMNEVKIRSSANAEDIPNFDGAGLHDSFSAALDEQDNADFSCIVDKQSQGGVVTKLKITPKTPQCALKGVYASLWNPRAIEERSFARLDHATSAMGIAVVPEYDAESAVVANGVIITRVINGEDILGYTLSLQQGNNLVTNPDPGTIAQLTIASFSDLDRAPRFTVARFATPKKNGVALKKSVLTEAQMKQLVEVARKVESTYCSVKPGYYKSDCRYVHIDNDKDSSLDMEFKILANGHIALKQVREFHGK